MATLLQYNFTGGVTTPTTNDSNFTVSSVVNNTATPLALFATGNLGYATDTVLQVNPNEGSTSAALAVTNNQYFTFSLSPNSGISYTITSVTFDVARGGSSAPRGYALRSSVDGYAANISTQDVTTVRPTFTSITSIDLSGNPTFQNLTTQTTFRMYVYAPTSGNSLDFDSITVNGTVGAAGTVVQEGFRFRYDDGSQTTATWIAAQDVNIIRQKLLNTRLRILLNSTLDRASENYQLEYRNVADLNPQWKKI